jgi:OsmC-like protein
MQETIRIAFERAAKALTLRPSLGRDTGVTTVRIRDGLTCDVEAGPWRFVADMPAAAGGSEAGPTPGVYGRAAFGSCLAIGYMMYAARRGVPIRSLEVEVQADYDDAALYGVSDSPPGYLGSATSSPSRATRPKRTC